MTRPDLPKGCSRLKQKDYVPLEVNFGEDLGRPFVQIVLLGSGATKEKDLSIQLDLLRQPKNAQVRKIKQSLRAIQFVASRQDGSEYSGIVFNKPLPLPLPEDEGGELEKVAMAEVHSTGKVTIYSDGYEFELAKPPFKQQLFHLDYKTLDQMGEGTIFGRLPFGRGFDPRFEIEADHNGHNCWTDWDKISIPFRKPANFNLPIYSNIVAAEAVPKGAWPFFFPQFEGKFIDHLSISSLPKTLRNGQGRRRERENIDWEKKMGDCYNGDFEGVEFELPYVIYRYRIDEEVSVVTSPFYGYAGRVFSLLKYARDFATGGEESLNDDQRRLVRERAKTKKIGTKVIHRNKRLPNGKTVIGKWPEKYEELIQKARNTKRFVGT
jgi:hypothetical protein